MMFSRKQLVYLIVPLIVEQVFLGTIGIADMLMVAPVGEVAISGISLVNSINMLFHSVFSALAAGGSIMSGKQETSFCFIWEKAMIKMRIPLLSSF